MTNQSQLKSWMPAKCSPCFGLSRASLIFRAPEADELSRASANGVVAHRCERDTTGLCLRAAVCWGTALRGDAPAVLCLPVPPLPCVARVWCPEGRWLVFRSQFLGCTRTRCVTACCPEEESAEERQLPRAVTELVQGALSSNAVLVFYKKTPNWWLQRQT